MKIRTLACAGLGLAAASRVALRKTGATRYERTRPLPGDDLVPGAGSSWTLATTIDAPPEAVWRWLVQIGCDRAGFYSFDSLDNGGRPSVEEIRPEWQTLEPGDHLASHPSGRTWFVVAEVDPERTLVLRASLEMPSARPYDPDGERPRFFVDSSWAFALEPLASRTRLLVRTSSTARPRRLARLLTFLFFDPAHYVMQTRQLARLRHLAESTDVVHAA
jgi:proline iminopeptidase